MEPGSRASSSRRRTLFLGLFMVIGGIARLVLEIVDKDPESSRLVVGGFGLASAAFGALLLFAAHTTRVCLEPLLLTIGRGQGVLWYFLDRQEFENGCALLILIDEAGTRHVWILPSSEVDPTLALFAKLLPTAQAGADEKLRQRFEADKEGVLRELVARRATRAAQEPSISRHPLHLFSRGSTPRPACQSQSQIGALFPARSPRSQADLATPLQLPLAERTA